MEIKFQATLEKGKFKFFNPQMFRQHCAKFDGKEIGVTVSLWRKPRSGKQNGYYFGVVVEMLANHFGYTPDEMHAALSQMFLLDRTKKFPVVKSTTKLNTAEFEEYLGRIRTWASVEHGFNLPLPNETV
jgi:hypothetical protein